MEFSKSLLAEEYRLITQSNTPLSYFSYDAQITTPKETIPVITVVGIDRIGDFRESYVDQLSIQFVVGWGTYLKKILPYKEELELQLTRYEHDRNGNRQTTRSIVEDFVLVIPPQGESAALSNSPWTASEWSADITDLSVIEAQLQPKDFSIIRSEVFGGTFRDSTPFSVLMACLTHSMNNIPLEQEARIQGIDAVPPDNAYKRESVLIPHGTPIGSLADHLQTKGGGIYNAGIGCFLRKGYWHIWPLYNYKRRDQAKRTMMFIIMPSDKYRGVEKTYRQEGDHTVCLITGGVERIDPSSTKLLNGGNAVRLPNSHSIMEAPVAISGNRATALRNKNASEYAGVEKKGNTTARFTKNTVGTNSFHEASKLTERNGAFLMMVWENARPDIIDPGMQVEVAFLVGGVVEFIDAVVVKTHEYSAMSGIGLHQKVHQCSISVTVMVDRHDPAYVRLNTQPT